MYELPSERRKMIADLWSSTVDIRPSMLPSGHKVFNSGRASKVGIVMSVMMYLLRVRIDQRGLKI